MLKGSVMLPSIKNIHLFFVVCLIILLNSCGGQSGSSSSGGGNAALSSSTFSLAAPAAYPATSSASYIYLTLTNTSSSDVSGLNFSIPASSNTTGTNNITVANGSSNPCYSVAAGNSCTFPVTVAANPNQGSFGISVSVPSDGSSSSFSETISSVTSLLGINTGQTFELSATIGEVNVPANTSIGADGISFLYNSPITAAASGSTVVPITAVVGSNVGTFNTLNLTTVGGGTLLNFSVLSGNSGTGLGNLAPGSVVSFNLIVPAGVTSYSFYAQALQDGNLITRGQATFKAQNSITLNSATTPTGILTAQPQSFSLNTSQTSQSQTLTYTNSGNGPITSISITPQSPLVAGDTTCSGTLAVNSSCTYTVSVTPYLSGNSSIVANYNNGQVPTSATSQVTYTGINPESGLTITSNNNFTFAATTVQSSNSTQITIQNTGNSSESNITFTVPTYFSLSAGRVNSCNLSGTSITDTLVSNGSSCTLILTYTNQQPTSLATASLGVSYTYGSGQSATTSTSLSYSTTQSSAALTITPATQNFGTIANNGNQSTTYPFIVNNASSDTAAINVNSTITGANASLFTQSGTCGSTINAESSCSISVNFGPTSASTGSESAQLQISYTPYANAATLTSTSSLTGTVRLPTSANMSASYTGSGFAGGDGESANTTFQIQSGNTGTLNVVYTNNGNAAAANFTTTAATGISPWIRSAHGCNSATIAIGGGTCTDTYTLTTATPGANNFNYSNITASYSSESGTVTNQQIIPSSGQYTYVNVYAAAAITTTTQQLASSQAMQGESFNLIATLSGGYNVNQTVSVGLSPASSGVAVSPSQCTLQSSSQSLESCSFNVVPAWNVSNLGNYTLSLSGTSITPSPSSVAFSVVSPSVYLPQTGESAGTNGCGAIAGSDCVLQTGIKFTSSRFVQGTGSATSCLTDTLTGLMWESNPAATFSSLVSFSAAISAVASLNTAGYCGYNDWRLPNINELRSLVNYGQSNPGTWLNTQGFSGVLSTTYSYWASSVYAYGGTNYYWIITFNTGVTSVTPNGTEYVWAVRGGESALVLPATVAQVPQTGESAGTNGCGGVAGSDCIVESGVAWPNPRFSTVITTNGTCVTDNLTGLMWAQNANLFGTSISWSTAESDIAAMNTNPAATGGYLCGYTDWRLPNINEMVSLVNYGQPNQGNWLNSQGFNGVQTANSYWSSSVYGPTGSGYYWIVYFAGGSTNSAHSMLYVWPVRGGK